MPVPAEQLDIAIDRAEEAILAEVTKSSRPVSARTVTDLLQREGHDKSTIVSAIWFLIDSRKLNLTEELLLVAS